MPAPLGRRLLRADGRTSLQDWLRRRYLPVPPRGSGTSGHVSLCSLACRSWLVANRDAVFDPRGALAASVRCGRRRQHSAGPQAAVSSRLRRPGWDSNRGKPPVRPESVPATAGDPATTSRITTKSDEKISCQRREALSVSTAVQDCAIRQLTAPRTANAPDRLNGRMHAAEACARITADVRPGSVRSVVTWLQDVGDRRSPTGRCGDAPRATRGSRGRCCYRRVGRGQVHG